MPTVRNCTLAFLAAEDALLTIECVAHDLRSLEAISFEKGGGGRCEHLLTSIALLKSSSSLAMTAGCRPAN